MHISVTYCLFLQLARHTRSYDIGLEEVGLCCSKPPFKMSRFTVILACHDELISGTVYVILTVTNIFETSTIRNG